MEKNSKKIILLTYLVSLGIGGIVLIFSHFYMEDNSGEILIFVVGALWGAFTFFMNRSKLPEKYSGKRNGVDGVEFFGLYEMKMPGIVFTDSNWPHVVLLERIWSCMLMAVYPSISLVWYLYNKISWEETRGTVIILFFVSYIMLLKLVAAKYE